MWQTIVICVIGLIILVTIIVILKKRCPDLHKVSLRLFGSVGPQVDAVFKEQINRIAKATEDESKVQAGPTTFQSVTLEERIEQLENENKILKKVVLGTSTVAISTAIPYLEQERIDFFKQLRDQTFKDLSESETQSDLVEYVYPLLRECSTCNSYSSGWGTCKIDNSKRDPTYVCDNWVSHPKS